MASPPPPLGTPPWELLGADELGALQEQLELLPLLRLRATSKAVRTQLDAVAPPKIEIAHWILGQKLDGWGDAHAQVQYADCILKAPTATLLDVYKLLQGMACAIGFFTPADKRFDDRWSYGLRLAIEDRVSDVIHGDGGRGTLLHYEGMTAAEIAARYGPPLPLSEDERIALLARMFDPMDRFIRAPLNACQNYPDEMLTPLTIAAIEGKVGVVRYLASRNDVNAHARDQNGFNVYQYVDSYIHEWLGWQEENECEFPDSEIFDAVQPGDTYALYMERRREELRVKYAPVKAYLRDVLGISTRDEDVFSSSSSESQEEESESEEDSVP